MAKGPDYHHNDRDYSAHTRGVVILVLVAQTSARLYYVLCSPVIPNLGMSPTLDNSVPRVPGFVYATLRYLSTISEPLLRIVEPYI